MIRESEVSDMGPLPQTITIGRRYDNPVIRLTNADFQRGGVMMDRAIDFSGRELIIDDLTATVRVTQAAAQGFITVDGNAFLTSAGEGFLAQSGVPKDKVVTGYVEFHTGDGQLFLTASGQTFQVPVMENLDDFWESLFDQIAYGTPVWYEVNGRSYKFFWKNYKRTGKYEFSMTAQSAIGLLDRPSDGDTGGMFEGTPLKDRIAAIIGGIVPYAINPDVENIPVYGWQPVQSRRDALRDLMLAYGVIIRRDDNGDLYFTLPPDESVTVDYGRVFLGGSVDRNDDKKYSRVDVTEHVFVKTENDKEVTLFDNTDGSDTAENLKVIFTQAPVYDITPSGGLSVDENKSNCNYATVTGSGVLTGKQYTRITQTVSVEREKRENDPETAVENILSVQNAALVSYLNSEYVATRIRDYYNAYATVQMDFIRRNENPGDLIQFTDPYGKERSGFLTAVKSKATSFDRATASVVCGYAPKYWGNVYDSVIALDGSGTWTAPEEMDGQRVRVVLIGGGQGGSSGQHGTDERKIDDETVTVTGCGKGSPGSGGRVKVVKLSVTAGLSFRYHCGAGGAGGTPFDKTTYNPYDDMPVYITNAGNLWHIKTDCDAESGIYSPTTYLEAARKGLKPCEKCVRNGSPRYLSNPGSEGEASVFSELDGEGNAVATYSSADGNVIADGYADIIHGTRYALAGPDYGVDGGQATAAKENTDALKGAVSEARKTATVTAKDAFTDIATVSVTPKWGDATRTSGGVGASAARYVKETERTDDGDRDVTYTNYAFGGLGGGAAVGNDGGQGGNGSINTVGSYNALGGVGGNGADASAVFPTPDERAAGTGGSGGHGGGEGGQGGSYYDHNKEQNLNGKGENGAGGSGSDGQPGADGCILIYYRKPKIPWRFRVGADGHLILRYDSATAPPFSLDERKHLLYTYSGTPPTLSIGEDGHLYQKG